jgi:hypothetical protein
MKVTRMTEQEWLDCQKPGTMFRSLPHTGLDRKYRLFACACVRRLWHLFDDERPRRAVETSERYADGEADEKQLSKAYSAAKRFATDQVRQVIWATHNIAAYHAAYGAKSAEFGAFACASAGSSTSVLAAGAAARGGRTTPADYELHNRTNAAEEAAQAVLLRDVLGYPFRATPVIDPAWLAWYDGTLPRLARSAYDDRILPEGTLRPEHLALVADALEDAGCSDAEILGHLRSPGPHVRGCWPLDLVLGTA